MGQIVQQYFVTGRDEQRIVDFIDCRCIEAVQYLDRSFEIGADVVAQALSQRGSDD